MPVEHVWIALGLHVGKCAEDLAKCRDTNWWYNRNKCIHKYIFILIFIHICIYYNFCEEGVVLRKSCYRMGGIIQFRDAFTSIRVRGRLDFLE